MYYSVFLLIGVFLEKNEIGCHCPSMYCCSTALTAVLEASVMMLVRACGFGWASKVADARASLTAEKACVVVSFHDRCSFPPESRALRGSTTLAHPGTR